ncbi:MAG: hypothetical protein EZS28_001466 [Streblomastix strix]|uniref:Uncharacterized protein n=1 Tax=Streblomastix strix TaxID=222440 RepID=A0A5J4X8V8_9EUKA|nr:MAG: hypothetical protein EZS28_001466 [Streblomastix strix]
MDRSNFQLIIQNKRMQKWIPMRHSNHVASKKKGKTPIMREKTPGQRVELLKQYAVRGNMHKKFCFDDEAVFYANCPQSLQKGLVRQSKSKSCAKAKVQRAIENVWGCIGFVLKSRVEIVPSNVNAEVYQAQLQRNYASELCAKGYKKLDKNFWGAVQQNVNKGGRNFVDEAQIGEAKKAVASLDKSCIDSICENITDLIFKVIESGEVTLDQ